ncbi:hypothetical protein, partial [Salmonella enterica]|uniref:hypothetical protein n=1 Tax=Salmonella enterica TaxID=28901 RepID=UPI0032982693
PPSSALASACDGSRAGIIDSSIVKNDVTLNSTKIRDIIMSNSSTYDDLNEAIQINSVSSFLWRYYHGAWVQLIQ